MATAGRCPHLHWQDLQQAKRKVEEARSMALQVSAKVAIVRPAGVVVTGVMLETDGVQTVLQFVPHVKSGGFEQNCNPACLCAYHG
ncbi:hypothetical protein EJB05_31421 [Eragrostis curvula]|uniref:Uncharacterized protein n=1 Tax=Eragrostis curvula TaxID=38414 RepID=A0A5J9UE80_9POAL|nr:hypothetical protein EJB05_31421 [Eragrostis curvula]